MHVDHPCTEDTTAGENYLLFMFIYQQNNIPVFSPALTDGALGDTLYFHSYKNPGLVIDIVEGKDFS